MSETPLSHKQSYFAATMQAKKHAGLIILIKFFVVGLTTAIIYFSCFAFLYSILKYGYKLSVTLSYIIAISFNFVMNKTITFKATNAKVIQQMLRYALLLLINYGLTLATVVWVVQVIHLSAYWGVIFSVTLTSVISFVLGKWWVYKS